MNLTQLLARLRTDERGMSDVAVVLLVIAAVLVVCILAGVRL